MPVGPEAARWATRGRCRRVLLVVHNVTSATRLLDVLPLFRDDLRVQLLATCTGSSPFLAGVRELLQGVGLPVLPWEQAREVPVDLAVSASYGGPLGELRGRVAVLSHGMGYNKRLAVGDRAPVFGMDAEFLLREGRPVAQATVLSHPEQLARLRASCPQAAATAVLAGDPCYDRILAALPQRDRFRRAFGLGPGQRLIVVNSTWGPRSLFGDGGEEDPLLSLLPRLTAELPLDEYRVAAVLHPNIWYGHGPGQVRAWLDGARRAGLLLVHPLDAWRQALIAADCLVGDHGSVTFYAAALGRPVLLGAFPEADLDPRSPVAALGRLAPRLLPHRGLRVQLDGAMGGHDPARYARLAAQVTSAPGRSAALLRGLFYRLMGLPEAACGPAVLDPLPLPSPAAQAGGPGGGEGQDPWGWAARTAPVRVLATASRAGAPHVRLVRYAQGPAEPEEAGPREPADAHTAVPESTPDPGRLRLADVILRYAAADDPRLGPPAAWAAEVLGRHPHCALAAYVTGPGRCVAVGRGEAPVRLTAAPDAAGRADLCDPAVYASALHAWLANGGPLREAVAAGLLVTTGGAVHRVRLET
ncbi:hypothetical protein D7294_29220 [Streptomyces hoynatensis]|uniref:Translation initiation factor 2 n=1 Tax=Streptomyces hoynatensis TaxID=1141874 RepID=A0A3A9YL42_9ACTN|nr:hypothetical protein D7294_29220 [Streptomyces hoynatensis]